MRREEVEVCPYCMGENIIQCDVEKTGMLQNVIIVDQRLCYVMLVYILMIM